MRLIKTISWMLLCSSLVLFCGRLSAQSPTRVAGQIVVAKASGTVTATHLTDQSVRNLSEKDVLTQQYVVKTGPNSKVVLVFSNGATLNLGADTVLSIDEFLQDPFSDRVMVADLKEEPTTSTTRLNLARGELVGNVKHLRHEKGSSFIVATPVGAAGIRGTTFRIVYQPGANGHATFTLSTEEGTVVFESPGHDPITVGQGREISVDVQIRIDPVTGNVTIAAPPVFSAVHELPAAVQAIIAVAVQEIVEAAKEVILSTAPAPATGANPNSPEQPVPQAKKQDENPTKEPTTPPKSQQPEPDFKPAPNQPPDIVTPPPNVTPGAGAN